MLGVMRMYEILVLVVVVGVQVERSLGNWRNFTVAT